MSICHQQDLQRRNVFRSLLQLPGNDDQLLAQKLTSWENHAHHSTHAASLTLKSFILAVAVAYLGPALTAFVYIPFREEVMRSVQGWLFVETACLLMRLVVRHHNVAMCIPMCSNLDIRRLAQSGNESGGGEAQK